MVPHPSRARIAVVSVRFTLFDEQMGADFPTRMRLHAARSAAILREAFDVVEAPLIESEADAARVAEMLAAEVPEAVVFAPAMAAPPSYAELALSRTTAPIVIWNAPAIRRLPDDLRQDEATVHSTSVGAVMFGNVLVRSGRRFSVVTAAHDDPPALERLCRVIRAAAAAGSLRGARVVRIGDPIPGYLDVEASESDLAILGLTELSIERARWEQLVSAVSMDAATSLLEHCSARWQGDPGPAADWSARVAVALEQLLVEHDAIGGTVNCHSQWFRRSPAVGVTACLGVACQTEAGRPISCTGDLPTAIALYLARRIAGAALYCECYAPEIETGLVLVAAGGEGDPAWADPPEAVRLEANEHYPGERGPGTSVSFALAPGPATLLSLSPTQDGWRLAWAPGEIVETRFPRMGGPNAMFRFDSGPADDALSRWITSGATHHNALAPGRLDLEVPALAAALGIREVRV
jgi:L-arabinose isomerase